MYGEESVNSQKKDMLSQYFRGKVNCCFSPSRTLLITVTEACNQQCQHCMRSSGPTKVEPLNFEKLRHRIANAVTMLRPQRVVISGGEPTLLPNLVDLVSLITSLGVPPSVCSNATTINCQKAVVLAQAGLHRVTIGIEGLGQTYERFRGSPGSFKRAMEGMQAFINAGISVTVNISLHNEILDFSKDFAFFLSDFNLRSITVTSPIFQGHLCSNYSKFDKVTEANAIAFSNSLAQLVPFPVDLRIPRCSASSCPSGKEVFSMNYLGEVSACLDEGAINICDIVAPAQRAFEPA